MTARPFALHVPGEPRSARFAKRLVLLVLLVHLPIWAWSSYRAYVQVRALELRAADRVLRAGSVVRADVVSSARVIVQVRLELVQGRRIDTLGVREVPKNWDAVYDPRSRRDSLLVVLGPSTLARFRAGPAVLRAVGRGRPQWLREPPPAVRELSVEIAPP